MTPKTGPLLVARRAAAEALRRRLGFYADVTLPEFPADGWYSEDLHLRRYAEGDAAARLELENSRGMQLWDDDFVPMSTRAEFDAWLRSQDRRIREKRGPYALAIESADGGPYLGDITLWRLRDRRETAEFGIALLPGARGRNTAGRAVRATLNWIFASGTIRRVEIHHAVGNDAACFTARRCGIPVEGTLHRAFSLRHEDGSSEWLDVCAHGVCAEDLDPRRSGT